MPLTGDFKALEAFEKRLGKLKDASRAIAERVSPKIATLVTSTFGAQSTPYGIGWIPTKSGAPAFGGGDAAGRVLVRLVGKNMIRTSVLYPLHFHNAGTHFIGRKRGAAISRRVTSGYVGAVLRQSGLRGGAPRQRKTESDEAYLQRLQAFAANKAVRAAAKGMAKKHAREAAEEARAAGGWHDPPRPMIPDDGDGIPRPWEDAIRVEARAVLADVCAQEKR